MALPIRKQSASQPIVKPNTIFVAADLARKVFHHRFQAVKVNVLADEAEPREEGAEILVSWLSSPPVFQKAEQRYIETDVFGLQDSGEEEFADIFW